MELSDIRKEIDFIDNEIIKLLSERLAICEEAGKYKIEKGLAIKDEKREEELFDKIREIAKEKGINQDFSEKIFREIVAESRKIQEGLIVKKH